MNFTSFDQVDSVYSTFDKSQPYAVGIFLDIFDTFGKESGKFSLKLPLVFGLDFYCQNLYFLFFGDFPPDTCVDNLSFKAHGES